jgi:hypothetical protein
VARAESAYPAVRAEHHQLGVVYLYAEPEAALLFCENETNAARIFGAEPSTRFAKDGIGEHVLHGADPVNPDGAGTKAGAHVRLVVPAGRQSTVLVRLFEMPLASPLRNMGRARMRRLAAAGLRGESRSL